ncbi:hypothetical protein L0Y49_04950 [bacterium]|nr:hypothetical protein [bacterium]
MHEDTITRSSIAGEHDLATYANQVQGILERVSRYYHDHEKEKAATVVRDILAKLSYTIDVLALKYAYDAEKALSVEFGNSGLPKIDEFDGVLSDFRRYNDLHAKSFPMSILKENLIKALLSGNDPLRELKELGARAYLQSLDPMKLLFSFTPGTLELLGETVRVRSYFFSWCAYDSARHIPYVHAMLFKQDVSSPPLHENKDRFEKFLGRLRRESARAPSMNVLAYGIDSASDMADLHPRTIRRVRIGPLYFKDFITAYEELSEPVRALKEFGSSGDAIVLVKDEIIQSVNERIETRVLQGDIRRQIFNVSAADAGETEKVASSIEYRLFLSHRIAQHAEFHEPALVHAKKITFDSGGNCYDV